MYSRVHGLLLIILLGFLISCSESNTTEQTITEKDIAFDQLETFLSFETDSIAGPADIGFINSDTLAILDSRMPAVLLYDSKGSLAKKIGKEGKGPGEFVRPAVMQITGNRIYVLDFGNFGINEFDLNGNFVERHSFEGVNMGFAQVSMQNSERYLAPANGEQGALLQMRHSADSSSYFGEAAADKVEAVNIETAQKQISNGEIPDMFKNMVLTDLDDESYYAFLQSFGELQRYAKNGKLLWDKSIELPIKEKIFEQTIERNKNMQSNAIYPLTYASAMQVTSDALYIMMNVPEDEQEMLIRFDKAGNMQTIYRIDSDESSFDNFVVEPSKSLVYLTGFQLGNVYRTSLESNE